MTKTSQVEPHTFPDFADDDGIIVASDYGGTHREARYEAYSFLVSTPRRCRAWDLERQRIRRKFNFKRRIGYKNAQERQRAHVLPWFLTAAALLDAVTITVLLDRSLKTVFSSSGVLDRGRPELRQVAAWKAPAVERLLRAAQFAGLFASGLVAEGQQVSWLTDEDDIAANDERLKITGDAFASVVTRLTPFPIGQISIGTTAQDTGDLLLEDLVTIPDLAAGACVDLMSELYDRRLKTSDRVAVALPARSTKLARLVFWLNIRDKPHHHVVVAIDPGEDGRIYFRRINTETVDRPRTV